MWLGSSLEALQRRRKSGPLWSFESALLTTAVWQAALMANVGELEPQLYSLRHGGASHDALAHRRPLAAIKRRGRWKADSSVKHYEKAAAAHREAHRLPDDAREYAAKVEAHLSEIMLGWLPATISPRSELLPAGLRRA